MSDWIKVHDEVFQLEAWFPLSADPGLSAEKIEIGAQVSVNTLVGFTLNDIVFRCPYEKGKFKTVTLGCIHTIVYVGSLDDVLELDEDAMRDGFLQHEENVSLPPWEHFTALKSYVAAVAEAGIGNLLRASRARDPDAPEMRSFGFNGRMQSQIIGAIHRFPNNAASALLRDYLLELYDTTSHEWFINHFPIFEERFFFDKETLAEIKRRWEQAS